MRGEALSGCREKGGRSPGGRKGKEDWREASGYPDTCCHCLVVVSCLLSGRACTENTMTRRCFLFCCVVHCGASRGRVYRSVFFTLPGSLRKAVGAGEDGDLMAG